MNENILNLISEVRYLDKFLKPVSSTSIWLLELQVIQTIKKHFFFKKTIEKDVLQNRQINY